MVRIHVGSPNSLRVIDFGGQTGKVLLVEGIVHVINGEVPFAAMGEEEILQRRSGKLLPASAKSSFTFVPLQSFVWLPIVAVPIAPMKWHPWRALSNPVASSRFCQQYVLWNYHLNQAYRAEAAHREVGCKLSVPLPLEAICATAYLFQQPGNSGESDIVRCLFALLATTPLVASAKPMLVVSRRPSLKGHHLCTTSSVGGTHTACLCPSHPRPTKSYLTLC